MLTSPSASHKRLPSRAVFMTVLWLITLALLGVLALNVVQSNASVLRADSTLIEALRASDKVEPIGPWWLKVIMVDLTALGGRTVIAFITLIAAGYLTTMDRTRSAIVLTSTIASGALLNMLLKSLFDRVRPDLVSHLADAHSTSFPSAHAMNSAIAYLTLGALIGSESASRSTRLFLMTAAIVVTLLVGFSRVYLGVHWPSDVIVGWGVGACWVALCLAIAKGFQRNREHGLAEPQTGSQRVSGPADLRNFPE